MQLPGVFYIVSTSRSDKSGIRFDPYFDDAASNRDPLMTQLCAAKAQLEQIQRDRAKSAAVTDMPAASETSANSRLRTRRKESAFSLPFPFALRRRQQMRAMNGDAPGWSLEVAVVPPPPERADGACELWFCLMPAVGECAPLFGADHPKALLLFWDINNKRLDKLWHDLPLELAEQIGYSVGDHALPVRATSIPLNADLSRDTSRGKKGP